MYIYISPARAGRTGRPAGGPTWSPELRASAIPEGGRGETWPLPILVYF